jgi:uncharacterized LabA/DUF88 family protein
MSDQSYLFIDGAYLRQRHSEMMSRVFSKTGVCDLSYLRQNIRQLSPFGKREIFQRVFYYDCLDDIVKTNEDPDQLKTRIREQEEFFEKIRALEGFHVRLGSLSGTSKKKRQKEVDILLTVEMLDHAFRKNMTSATLIAGDLDFAPLLDSLVRLGTWVDVLYDPKSIAQGLLASADRGIPIRFHDYYLLATREFQTANQLPQSLHRPTWKPEEVGYVLLRSGHLPDGDLVRLFRQDPEHFLFLYKQNEIASVLSHRDPAVLENFFVVTQSPLEWEAGPVEQQDHP